MRKFILITLVSALASLTGINTILANSPPPARQVDLAIAGMPDITGGVRHRMDGHYGRTIQAVLAHLDIAATWRLTSPDHAYRGFYKAKFSCVTPDSANVYPKNRAYIDSLPLTIIDWIALSAHGSTALTRQGDLYGKRVGLPYAVDALVNVVPAAGPAYSVNSDSYQLLRMLENGRLDAVVLTASEFRVLQQQRDSFRNLVVDSNKPLARNPEGFMCHDTKRGRVMIDALNRAINAIGPEQIRAKMQLVN